LSLINKNTKATAKVRVTKHQYRLTFIYSITSISNCLDIWISANSFLIINKFSDFKNFEFKFSKKTKGKYKSFYA